MLDLIFYIHGQGRVPAPATTRCGPESPWCTTVGIIISTPITVFLLCLRDGAIPSRQGTRRKPNLPGSAKTPYTIRWFGTKQAKSILSYIKSFRPYVAKIKTCFLLRTKLSRLTSERPEERPDKRMRLGLTPLLVRAIKPAAVGGFRQHLSLPSMQRAIATLKSLTRDR